MSQAKVKATRLKTARAGSKQQSQAQLAEQQTLVDAESHNFRLGDTTTQVGSTIFTVFHIKEAKIDVEKRIQASRQPYQYNPYKRFADLSLYQQVIPIPLRPAWNNKLTREELQANEVAKFDDYLQVIYDNIPPSRLTHFEHNLDVWRQLWRVCEISDVLCACVDARYPLFHFPPALYDYIANKLQKPIILVLNKIDLVPRAILYGWEKYLKRAYPKVHIIMFTSHPNPGSITGADNTTLTSTSTAASAAASSNLNDNSSIQLTKGMSVSGAGGSKQTGAGSIHKYQPVGAALLKTFWNILSAVVDAKQEENVNTSASDIVDDELIAFALDYARRIGAADVVNRGEDSNNDNDDPSKPRAIYRALGDIVIPNDVLVTDSMEAEEKGLIDINKTTINKKKTKTNPEDTTDDEEDSEVEDITKNLLKLQNGDDGNGNNNNDDDMDEVERLDNQLRQQKNNEQQINNNKLNKYSLTVGMVGHPNAGKSSLINALLGRAAVSVSNAPGHTKHLQTLCAVPNCQNVRLCDCPGLVFPAVDISRSLQTLLGIFPYPKLAEPYSCVQFLAERLPLINIYQLKPYIGGDSDAALYGASHPGGSNAAFVEEYEELILKTKYNGQPSEFELKNKHLLCVTSTTDIHNVFIPGTVTSSLPDYITMNQLSTTTTNNNAQTTTTTNNKNSNVPNAAMQPLIVNGIDIAALAPPPKKGGNAKNNNNNKNNKATTAATVTKKGNNNANSKLIIQDDKNQIDVFSTLDNMLTNSKFDTFTNPRFVWSAFRMCESYAVKKGWYTEGTGKPDTFKAGMAIVKDCVDGRLNLYFLPPQVRAQQKQQ